MARVLSLALIALLAAASGCARKDVLVYQKEQNLPNSTAIRSATAPVSLSMSVPRAVLGEAGAELPVTLVLTNRDDKPINLTYTSARQFDVLMRDSRGKPAMRWSDNRAFTQALMTEHLPAGEKIERTLVLRFTDAMEPGTYTIVGMTTGGVPLETEPLRIRYQPGLSGG